MDSKTAGNKSANASRETVKLIEQMINDIAAKYPAGGSKQAFTDIHLRVSQDSGELAAFDDDDNEIAHCIVEQWIDNESENFYDTVAAVLRKEIGRLSGIAGQLNIMKPYSYVLETDEKEHVAELFVADDDTVIIGGDLMPGLDKELDNFLKKLLRD